MNICKFSALSHSHNFLTISKVSIYKVNMSIENGISAVRDMALSIIQLGDGKVLDVKFADDELLLALWVLKGEQVLKTIRNRD